MKGFAAAAQHNVALHDMFVCLTVRVVIGDRRS